jgi:hypothetical protein
MFTLKDLQDKVEKGISDYIGFDVREIFNQSDYISIYGGSVRDSIAGLEIHDIDILCMPSSAHKLRSFLKNKYNYKTWDYYDQDALNIYKGVPLISEPWTLMNDNKRIIQIIRPANCKSVVDYMFGIQDIVKNVDLSSCGVLLEKPGKDIVLIEACKDAIIHSLSKIFEVNEWSQLYKRDRTFARIHKLESRGWTNLLDILSNNNSNGFPPNSFLYKNVNSLKINRLMKLNKLEFKPEREYKVWTEGERLINQSLL